MSQNGRLKELEAIESSISLPIWIKGILTAKVSLPCLVSSHVSHVSRRAYRSRPLLTRLGHLGPWLHLGSDQRLALTSYNLLEAQRLLRFENSGYGYSTNLYPRYQSARHYAVSCCQPSVETFDTRRPSYLYLFSGQEVGHFSE